MLKNARGVLSLWEGCEINGITPDVKRLFASSEKPAAIIKPDGKAEIISEKAFPGVFEFCAENYAAVFNGTQNIVFNGKRYEICCYCIDESIEKIVVINSDGDEKDNEIFGDEVVRKYLRETISLLTASVSAISAGTEGIYEICEENDIYDVTEYLDIQTGSCHRILRALDCAAQLVCENDGEAQTVCADEILRDFAKECDSVFKKYKPIETEYEKNICIKVPPELFLKVLITAALFTFNLPDKIKRVKITLKKVHDDAVFIFSGESEILLDEKSMMTRVYENADGDISAIGKMYAAAVECFCVKYGGSMLCSSDRKSLTMRFPSVEYEETAFRCLPREYKPDKFTPILIGFSDLLGYRFY